MSLFNSHVVYMSAFFIRNILNSISFFQVKAFINSNHIAKSSSKALESILGPNIFMIFLIITR